MLAVQLETVQGQSLADVKLSLEALDSIPSNSGPPCATLIRIATTVLASARSKSLQRFLLQTRPASKRCCGATAKTTSGIVRQTHFGKLCSQAWKERRPRATCLKSSRP
jgi:hypothetical protein